MVAVGGLLRAKSIPSGLGLGATWWQHPPFASPSLRKTGDCVADWSTSPETFLIIAAVSLPSAAAPIPLLQSATSASPAPTSLTSCGPTLSLPSWPPHSFLAPLGLPVGTPHSSETSRSLQGRTWGRGSPPSWAFPVVKTGPLSIMLLVSSSPTLPTSPLKDKKCSPCLTFYIGSGYRQREEALTHPYTRTHTQRLY